MTRFQKALKLQKEADKHAWRRPYTPKTSEPVDAFLYESKVEVEKRKLSTGYVFKSRKPSILRISQGM